MEAKVPPIAATKLVRRPCCRRGTYSFIEPPDIEHSMSATFGREPLPVIEEVDESPPEERTAWHEAGHSVIGFALGNTIDMVTVRAPARVRYKDMPDGKPLHEVARSHAGHVGEMARLRCWISGWPEDEDEFLERVHAFQFGGCDRCQMAIAAWKVVGINSPIELARMASREGKALSLRLGQRRDVQLAIRALAAALMDRHTLSGAEAHAIMSKYIGFGGLLNVEENQDASGG